MKCENSHIFQPSIFDTFPRPQVLRNRLKAYDAIEALKQQLLSIWNKKWKEATLLPIVVIPNCLKTLPLKMKTADSPYFYQCDQCWNQNSATVYASFFLFSLTTKTIYKTVWNLLRFCSSLFGLFRCFEFRMIWNRRCLFISIGRFYSSWGVTLLSKMWSLF